MSGALKQVVMPTGVTIGYRVVETDGICRPIQSYSQLVRRSHETGTRSFHEALLEDPVAETQ